MKKINTTAILYKLLGLDVIDKMQYFLELEKNKFNNVEEYIDSKYKNLIQIAKRKSKIYSNCNTDDASDVSIDKNILLGINKEDILTSLDKTYLKKQTAGTTGKPINIFIDKDTLSWQLAARHYLFSWYNINLSDKEARFWGRPLTGELYKIADWCRRRKRFSFIGDEQVKQIEYERFIKYKPDYIYGYSSLILNAANYIARHDLKVPALKAVICTAETVTKYQKHKLKEIFNCPVIEEYGCTEVDIIAFECEQEKLHVFSPRIRFLINEKSEAVVTDLDNKLMPIINYNLGDIIKPNNGTCKCLRALPIIEQVEGRNIQQIFKYKDGKEMHAVVFAYMMERIASRGHNIGQFKVIYDDVKFIVYIESKFNTFSDDLKNEMEEQFGKSVNYEVVCSESLFDSNQQKFTYFENTAARESGNDRN